MPDGEDDQLGPGGSRAASRTVPRGGSAVVAARGPEVAGVIMVRARDGGRDVAVAYAGVALRSGPGEGTPVGRLKHADGRGRFRIPLPAGVATDQLRLVISLEDELGIVRVSYFDGTQPWTIPWPAQGYLAGDLGRLRVQIPRDSTTVRVHDDNQPSPPEPRITGTLTARPADATWVYLTIIYGKSWYASQRLAHRAAAQTAHTPPLPPITFPHLRKVAVIYPANEHTVDYHQQSRVPDIPGGVIRLTARAADSPSVILHEYGHHVVHEAIPTYSLPSGTHFAYGDEAFSRYVREHRGQLWRVGADGDWEYSSDMPARARLYQLAMDLSEGYATFFGQNALEWPHYREREFRIDDDIEDMTRSDRRRDVRGCTGYGDVPTAAWLWDLTDPAQGDDTIQLPFWEVHAHFIRWGGQAVRWVGPTGPLVLSKFACYLRTAYASVPGFAAALDAVTRHNRLSRVMADADRIEMIESPAGTYYAPPTPPPRGVAPG